MAGSRRRRFPTRASWVDRVRRSTHRDAKLASSSSDGSPERPVKVVVIGDAGGGGDGRPVCVPAFGGRGGIPKSIDKIEEGGASSAPLKLGAGGASSEPLKLGAGGGISKSMEKIGEGGAKSTPVKLGAGGDGDGSLDRVVSIGRSRLRVDHLGQFYVLDSEDEGTDAEVGTVVDPAREVAKVMDPPRASPTVADLPAKVGTSGAPVVEGTTVQAAVDVPVGAATADELHPEVDQLFKKNLYWTWYYMQCVDCLELLCR